MPISTNKGVIHEKRLHPSMNQHLSRFIVENKSAEITKTGRNLLHETIPNEPEALVAQPAERRFRNDACMSY
jgi:hypothetical protein